MDLFTMIMACSLYPDNSVTNAIVQIGSRENPMLVTSIAADGTRTTKSSFTSVAQAANYARAEMEKGAKVDIGLMQLPARWLSRHEGRVSLEELFRPCKNMVIATDAINTVSRQCAAQDEEEPTCVLSMYKTGDPHQGKAYAEEVLAHAAQHRIQDNPQNLELKRLLELPEPDFTHPIAK